MYWRPDAPEMGQRAAPAAKQTHTSDDKKHDWTRYSNPARKNRTSKRVQHSTYRGGLGLGHSSSVHGLHLALPN